MDWYFELSWEICHKQGGIYTSLRTKADAMMKKWHNRQYIMIGPYLADKLDGLFQAATKPTWLNQIEQHIGLNFCHFGHWNIIGKPNVILLDIKAFLSEEELTPILDILSAPNFKQYFYPIAHEIHKEVAFAVAVFTFFTAFKAAFSKDNSIAHFHEWQAACAIPLLKQHALINQIIFTTHATQLGRLSLELEVEPLIKNGFNFAGAPPWMQTNQALKHIIEIKAAENADTFLVTSEVIQKESIHYLQVKPHAILYPGLNIRALQEEIHSHRPENRQLLTHFLQNHFPPDNKDQTSFTFIIAGRHEYQNKGFDITLNAIKFLNQEIRQYAYPWKINFIIVADGAYIGTHDEDQISHEVLKGQANWFLSKKRPNMVDPIIRYIVDEKLDHPDNPVRILYHPAFVSKKSCFKLDYKDLLSVCDMGIFPSAYEPWGYTAVEALAIGVPSVISKQSGLGVYLETHYKDPSSIGAFIIDRHAGNLEKQAHALAHIFVQFCTQAKLYQNNAATFANQDAMHLDWENLLLANSY